MLSAMPIWRSLLMHWVRNALDLARASTGNNIAARIAMIAITTNNSIRVKPTRSNRGRGPWKRDVISPMIGLWAQIVNSNSTISGAIMKFGWVEFSWCRSTCGKLVNLSVPFGGFRLRLGQRQALFHAGPFVAGVGEPGVFHHALLLLNQFQDFLAARVKRHH